MRPPKPATRGTAAFDKQISALFWKSRQIIPNAGYGRICGHSWR